MTAGRPVFKLFSIESSVLCMIDLALKLHQLGKNLLPVMLPERH